MFLRFQDYWTCLFRCRKKRLLIISTIMLILAINATFIFRFELYKIVARRPNILWNVGSHNDKYFYAKKSMQKVNVGYTGESTRRHFSLKILNKNGYAPVAGAGEEGKPVQLSSREQKTAQELYFLHSYNILVSDRISVNRSLPDMRSISCANMEYDIENLPTASIIIVFHNEAWSVLIRTIMSVIMRSPSKLLKQIILVDDASDRKYLFKELENAIAKVDKIHLLRSRERFGLVKARLTGARSATGDILVFLDSHCEVTEGWLEPLLDRADSADVFVCPHIDILSDDTLAYLPTVGAKWGSFSRRLQFRFISFNQGYTKQKQVKASEPYPTPAMAGGLFAVRRSLFWRLGGYDEGMLLWGGENLELSWRAWQCGARVEITDCSRVGHIFTKTFPYKFADDFDIIINNNLARAALVWMDEWADFYFKFNPKAKAVGSIQNVTDRIELRKKLNCKSFKWYLDNVWPVHHFPTDDRWFGMIRNDKGACIGIGNADYKVLASTGGPSVGVRCGNIDTLLVFTPTGQIIADELLCLHQGENDILWKTCINSTKQLWEQKGEKIKTKSGLCLTLIVTNSINGISGPLMEKECHEKSEQIWNFERVPWH